MNTRSRYENLCESLESAGLAPRGGFHVTGTEDVPRLTNGTKARTVVLAGNAGPAMWAAFKQGGRDRANPLDTWSRGVLEPIAERHGGELVMPSDGPPYAPFQRWAMRAEPVHPSPLGILIHPRWGLWHGYRGALLFAEYLALPRWAARPSPCETCADRPCLSSCPVGAFSDAGYAVNDCSAHLRRPRGEHCMTGGCLARRACPVGQDHHYSDAQASFHMAAFLAPRRGPRDR